MTRLKKERSWNLAKIKQYEKEVGTLRTIMRGYVRQIDSLNTLNKKAHQRRTSASARRISSANLRAEMAEEGRRAGQQGADRRRAPRPRHFARGTQQQQPRCLAHQERLAPARGLHPSRPTRLASPGNKALYVRITSPDGYVLTTEEMPTFEFEGERLSYSAMREVEYDNTKDLGVGIFYTSTGFTAGTYKIQIYCEGRLIGQTDVAMR